MTALRQAVRELCPDYPFKLDTPDEDLWALTEALRGSRLAIKDLHNLINQLKLIIKALPPARLNEELEPLYLAIVIEDILKT